MSKVKAVKRELNPESNWKLSAETYGNHDSIAALALLAACELAADAIEESAGGKPSQMSDAERIALKACREAIDKAEGR